MTDVTPAKVDIQDLVKVALLAADLGNAAATVVVEGGNISMANLGLIFQVMHTLKDAMDIDYKKAWLESKAMSPAQYGEIETTLENELHLPTAQVEDRVKSLLAISQRLFGVVSELVEWAEHPAAG